MGWGLRGIMYRWLLIGWWGIGGLGCRFKNLGLGELVML